MVVRARRSFQYFRQIICFLRNNGALSKFIGYQIFHYLISIIKSYRNQTTKANFTLTTQATLTGMIYSNRTSDDLGQRCKVHSSCNRLLNILESFHIANISHS